MKHCPNCSAEFEDRAEACTDCGVALEPGPAKSSGTRADDLSMADMTDLVSIGTASSQFEVERLKELFESEGIGNVLFVPRGGASADALSKMSQGFWDVRVLAAERVRATQLIGEVRADFAGRDPDFETSLRDEALAGTEADAADGEEETTADAAGGERSAG